MSSAERRSRAGGAAVIIAMAQIASLAAFAQPREPISYPRQFTAQSAVALAIRSHPAVAMASANVEARIADVRSAELQAGPSVSAAFTSLYGSGESTSFAVVQKVGTVEEPLTKSEGTYGSALLNLAVPLYSKGSWFNRDAPAVASAHGKYLRAKAELDAQMVDIAAQVANAYLGLLQGTEEVALQEQVYKTRRAHLEVMRERVAARLSTLSEQLAIESLVASATSDLEIARAKVDAAQRSLKTLIGMPAGQPLDALPLEADLPQLPNVARLIENAQNTHPAVLAQEGALASARAEVRVARAEYSPTLSFVSSAVAASNLHTPDVNRFYSVGLALTVPIADFGLNDSKVRSRALDLNQSELKLQAERYSVAQKVSSAYQNAQAAIEKVGPLRAKLAQYRQQEDASRAQYESKLQGLDRLLGDRAATLAGADALVEARYAAWLSYVTLVSAAGKAYGASSTESGK